MTFMDFASKIYTDAYNKLTEATTGSNIAFLPGGFTSVKTAMDVLKKKKKSWDIEILEDDSGRDVHFEKDLVIRVEHGYWKEFVEKVFGGEVKDVIIMEGGMFEDLDQELENAANLLQESIADAFNVIPLEELENDILKFKNHFGMEEHRNIDVQVHYHSKQNDLYRTLEEVKSIYSDDIGYLELIAKAFDEKSPLSMYRPFSDHNAIYGVSVQTRYNSVKMVFEAYVDNLWMITERIYIADPDVIDSLEDHFDQVRTVKTKVFPRGRRFSANFFTVLKDVIDGDVVDEDEFSEFE